MLPEEIRVVEMSNNDSWIRDCGATFVVNDKTGEVRGVDWTFNSWGGLVDGLYFPWDLDDEVARKMCDIEYKGRYRLNDFVLEGGSIHSDGDGTVMVTEECLLSEGRNPQLTKEEITQVLCDYLGADKVIWLKNGIYLDETNGHVDNICCFVKPGKVLLCLLYTSLRDAGGMKLVKITKQIPTRPTIEVSHIPNFPPGIWNARFSFGWRLR